MAQITHASLTEIGHLVEDTFEETFVLFSQVFPQNDLGIINDKAAEIEVEAGGCLYTFLQSSTLLRSSRVAGTTGAVVWKVTPLIAEWLGSDECILWKREILTPSSTVAELGCGIAGVIGMVLSSRVKSYILTDQEYVIRLLKENISRNGKSQTQQSKSSKRKPPASKLGFENLHILQLDWEHDSARNIWPLLPPDSVINMLLICDCIYNNYLIEPLTQTCSEICRDSAGSTVILIAQQLRTSDVFEEWLVRFSREFDVWRVKDDHLPVALRSDSGYIVHLAMWRGVLSKD